MLRRAGMHRVDFLQVLQRGSFKRIQAGDSILDLEHDDVSLFLMIEVRWCWLLVHTFFTCMLHEGCGAMDT